MTCTKIINGFVCSGTETVKNLTLKDGTNVWFEHHKNFGAFFWLDEDCHKEFPEWWNNEELIDFHDIYYGHKQEDYSGE